MSSSQSNGEAKYGGIVGPDAMYVKLISSDYHEFIIKREHALTSGTIKAMLSGPGKLFLCGSKIKILGCCTQIPKVTTSLQSRTFNY